MKDQYQQFAAAEATRQGLDPDLVSRVIQQESNWNPAARSPKGAVGLMQLMPDAAAEVGVRDRSNWQENIRGGVAYLKKQMDKYGDTNLALAAYNAGPGNVDKHGGVPPFPETQNYVARITGGAAPARKGPAMKNEFDDAFDAAMSAVLKPKAAPQAVSANPAAPATQTLQLAPEGTPQSLIAAEQAAVPQQEKPMSPLDPSTMENVLAAAGGLMVGGGRGMKQLGMDALKKLGVNVDTAPLQAEIDAAKQRDAPLMNSPAGIAGTILGGAAMALPTALIPGAGTYLGAGMIGAAMGGTQPVATGESRAQNAMVGAGAGVVGQGVANLAGRAIAPIRNALTGEQQRLVEVAAREGIPLDVAQQTGSVPMRTINNVLANLPGSAAAESQKRAGQQSAYSAAVLRRIGETGDEITPAVLTQARDRIGNEIQTIAQRNTINMGPNDPNRGMWGSVVADLRNALNTYEARSLPAHQRRLAQSIVRELEATDGNIPGTLYQNTRSQLSRTAFNTQDGSFATVLRGIRDTLDHAAEVTFPRQDAQALAQARQQWGLSERLSSAMGGANSSSGNVSGAQLRQAMASGQRGAYARGAGGDMNDLARVGDAFFRPMPDSTTAQRLFYQGLMTPGLSGAGAAGGYIAGNGDPSMAAAGAALGFVTPRAVQGILNNPMMMQYLISSPGREAASEVLTGVLRPAMVGGGSIEANKRMNK